jgi:hypothetical protein
MLAGIAHLLTPGQEAVVQFGEAGDAVRLGLGQEPLADEALYSRALLDVCRRSSFPEMS